MSRSRVSYVVFFAAIAFVFVVLAVITLTTAPATANSIHTSGGGASQNLKPSSPNNKTCASSRFVDLEMEHSLWTDLRVAEAAPLLAAQRHDAQSEISHERQTFSDLGVAGAAEPLSKQCSL